MTVTSSIEKHLKKKQHTILKLVTKLYKYFYLIGKIYAFTVDIFKRMFNTNKAKMYPAQLIKIKKLKNFMKKFSKF